MAKVTENKMGTTGVQFFDKTEKKWYVSKTEKKIILCDSIDDIINGKGETFEFATKEISKRIVVKDEKKIEKKFFVLFTLKDGNFLLLKRWYEFK